MLNMTVRHIVFIEFVSLSVYNAICAMGAALQMGIDMDTIIKGLENATGVVGRVEVVPTILIRTVILNYGNTAMVLKI